MTDLPVVYEATDADFEARVIERSRAVPVVVDFWAEWCGPCRVLGPVLEREVAALGGRVELVKVDTDGSPGLSQAFQIRSIPAVKAFRDGRVVDEFVGAQGAGYVRAFLERLAPSPERQSLDDGLAARKAGRTAEAEAALGRALAAADPAIAAQAAIALARVLVDAGRDGEAAATLGRIDPRDPLAETADGLRALLAFIAEAQAGGSESSARETLARSEGDLPARYALAGALAARGAWQEALEQLLEVVSRSRKFKDDAARRAMLTIFDHLGADDERAREFRRRLQVVT